MVRADMFANSPFAPHGSRAHRRLIARASVSRLAAAPTHLPWKGVLHTRLAPGTAAHPRLVPPGRQDLEVAWIRHHNPDLVVLDGAGRERHRVDLNGLDVPRLEALLETHGFRKKE